MSFRKGTILGNTAFDIYFDKINTVNGVKLFIFAKDRNGNSYCFNMEQTSSGWRIINAPKVPDIFISNEALLSEAINKSFEK